MLSKFFLFLRHAIALVRADKLFSAIYIAGTAVAIASAMVVVIVLNIKLADIKPEVNRSRTLYPHIEYHSSYHNSTIFSGFSIAAIDSCFSKLKSVEYVTGFNKSNETIYYKYYSDNFRVVTRMCDPNFFRLFEFTFIEGRPFSEKEFKNGENVCVITEDVAKKLSYKENEGTINKYGVIFRVVGVIKPVCTLMKEASAGMYYPYTAAAPFELEMYNKNNAVPMVNYAGSLNVEVLLREGYTRQDFLVEIGPIWKHYINEINTQSDEEINCNLIINNSFLHQMNIWSDANADVVETGLYIMTSLLILIFLFLPAINLSGLASNHMEARLPEMGIRKAFGAKRRTLLREVINENLVLTLCGGALGWALSWLFINAFRNNKIFLKILFDVTDVNPEAGMEFAMFFTPKLFLICFICCAVLNLMAALIPAWRSLRKPSVESLNQKR